MIRRLLILLGTGALGACATAPKQTAEVYHEAVTAVPGAGVSGACHAPPADVTEYRALLPLANACVKADDANQVEAFGQALATRAPQTPWGLYYLSLAALSRGDHARARWMIERAIRNAPDQALFHFQLARIHWAAHDDAGVHAEMALAAKYGPELTDAHVFEGQMALRQLDYARAKRELGRALAADPDHATALLTLAEVDLKSNDYAGAEGALTKAVRVTPRATAAWLELARVQETHLKKFEEALRTLTDARRLAAERKLDAVLPADVPQRIQSLEKTVAQAKRDQDSSRMPSAERK